MQDYDVTLKLLLQRSASLTMRAVTGAEIAKWLDVELPRVQNLRLDLLGETVDGGLIHVELQSANDPAIPIRMAEYALGIFRLLGRFPRQIVLYVGERKLRMDPELRGPGVLFQYQVIDIRMLDAGPLLTAPRWAIMYLRSWRDCGTIEKRCTGLCSASAGWEPRSGMPLWRNY